MIQFFSELDWSKKQFSMTRRVSMGLNNFRYICPIILPISWVRGRKFLWLGLEAFPVDDSRAGLVVLLLGDPHLLEGGEESQDGASDPDGVLPFWWGNDL